MGVAPTDKPGHYFLLMICGGCIKYPAKITTTYFAYLLLGKACFKHGIYHGVVKAVLLALPGKIGTFAGPVAAGGAFFFSLHANRVIVKVLASKTDRICLIVIMGY